MTIRFVSRTGRGCCGLSPGFCLLVLLCSQMGRQVRGSTAVGACIVTRLRVCGGCGDTVVVLAGRTACKSHAWGVSHRVTTTTPDNWLTGLISARPASVPQYGKPDVAIRPVDKSMPGPTGLAPPSARLSADASARSMRDDMPAKAVQQPTLLSATEAPGATPSKGGVKRPNVEEAWAMVWRCIRIQSHPLPR